MNEFSIDIVRIAVVSVRMLEELGDLQPTAFEVDKRVEDLAWGEGDYW